MDKAGKDGFFRLREGVGVYILKNWALQNKSAGFGQISKFGQKGRRSNFLTYVGISGHVPPGQEKMDMPYRNGTLVTQYQVTDEYLGYGERTCPGYEVDDRDEFNPMDVCIGMVINVAPEGIKVQWVHMCRQHQEEHMPRGWFEPDSLWEIGQLA